MKKIKLVKILLFVLLTTTLMFGLLGCGSDDNGNNGNDNENGGETVEVTYEDVYQDLLDAHAAVSENLNWEDTEWPAIMLADDIIVPETKYGILVVPFFPSDAVQRHTRTVEISEGNFIIEIVSSATGATWTIDQDGVISRR